MPPDIQSVISGGLLRLLADTFVLLFKTRHLSWRVNDDVKNSVCAVVRQDHRDLDDAADRIAHRILDLGRDLAPSYGELIRSSSVLPELETRPPMEMVAQVVADHDKVLADIDTLTVTLPLSNDPDTQELLDHLAACHRNCRNGLASLIIHSSDPHR